MNIDHNYIKIEASNCLKVVKNIKRKCFAKDCNSVAIKSHVIWKGGHLKNIAEDSHLYELNSYRDHNYHNLQFKKTGINNILSFSGFCNFHDTKIFSEIEHDSVDYSVRKNQILLSIRSIFHERVKKEEIVNYYKCLLAKKLIPVEEKTQLLKFQINHQILGIRDLIFYITELNKDYFTDSKTFVFKYFETSQLPVACSCLFSIDGETKMQFDAIQNPNWENEPLNSMIFNIIPHNGKSIIIFGYHQKFLENIKITNNLNELSKEELHKVISDILIERSESWVCKPSYYELKLKKIESQIIEQFNWECTTFTGRPNRNLVNLFENY